MDWVFKNPHFLTFCLQKIPTFWDTWVPILRLPAALFWSNPVNLGLPAALFYSNTTNFGYVLMYNNIIMIHDLKSQLQSTWFFVKISTNYCVLIRKTWNLKSSTNGVICYSPKLTLIADTIVKKSGDFKTCAGTFSKTHPALRENI